MNDDSCMPKCTVCAEGELNGRSEGGRSGEMKREGKEGRADLGILILVSRSSQFIIQITIWILSYLGAKLGD